MSPPNWVLHLPTRLTAYESAARLVEQLRDSLAHVPVLDFAAATLTEKDRMMVRHPVFCDRQLPERHGCALRADHSGTCVPVPWQRAV